MASLRPTLDPRCPDQWFVFWQRPWTAVPLGLLVGSGKGGRARMEGPWARMCLQAQGSELGLRPEWESEALLAVK